MTKTCRHFVVITLSIFLIGSASAQEKDARFLSFVTDPATIKFYWKDDKGQIFKSIQNLKLFIEANKRELRFAMNGGMYRNDNSPQGLYIENSKMLVPLDTSSG